MRSLFLIVGMIFAAGIAQAQIGRTVPLVGPHTICERMSTAAEIYARLEDPGITEGLRQLVQAGHCVILPTGTSVTLMRQDGVFSCLRPVGANNCGWTVMVPRQVKAFGLDVDTRRYSPTR